MLIGSSSRVLGLAIVVLLASFAWADDWPQWRGVHRDGVWRETGILEAIPPSGLKIRWRARIGSGYSGPVVAQGRVYVTDHWLKPEAERVLCFEEASGKPLWSHSYPIAYENMEYGNGPRVSPTIHEGKLYSLGTKGHLVCLDAATGELLWKKDLVAEYKARVPQYGASVAPLVEGDVVIVSPGPGAATVMAFDRHTGAERWKALDDRPAYSAPIIVEAGGCRQAIFWTGDSVASLDPASGKVHWQIPYKASFDPAQAVATPVLRNDSLLFLGAWSRGSLLLKLDPDRPEAEVVWKTRSKPSTTTSTPVYVDDTCFWSIDIGGNLVCVDAATGDERWSARNPAGGRFGPSHLTPNGDRAFLFDQTGHLMLAKLSPAGYEELGRCLLVEPTAGYRAAGNVAWAHPAYANRCVFARNDRELVCASLAADSVAAAETPVAAAKVQVLGDFKEQQAALGLSFSPDCERLALGTWDGQVKVLERASGKLLPAQSRHKDWICSVAYSPDGKLLVSAGGSEFRPQRNGGMTTGEVKVWDVAAGTERGPLVGHTNKVFSAVFSPDSTLIATGSADRTVRLWDAAGLQAKASLEGHTDAVSCVAFSPDGQTLASASWDKTVKLWSVAEQKELATLKGFDDEVLAVAISPKGKIVAAGSADGTIRLWDFESHALRTILKGHQGTVYAVAFSADGATLASGSGDETVKLWDMATLQERTTLRGHQSGVTALAWTRDGSTLASAGLEDPVRLWDLK